MSDTAYELLGNPLSDERRVSLWVTTDAGVVHRACGPQSTVTALGQRHVDAGICPRYELGACCESIEMACAFDVFGDVEDTDQVVILAVALARAEGRDIGQPYRCPVHGALTFGGCCSTQTGGESAVTAVLIVLLAVAIHQALIEWWLEAWR